MAHPHDKAGATSTSPSTHADAEAEAEARRPRAKDDSHPYASPVSSLPDPAGGATATTALSLSLPPSPQHTRDEGRSHSPTPNASSAGRKRKASGAPGNRGVANLNPEQLAKKRANDREAQRAIRERTKTTIEGLERRILELESQRPYQDLQKVVHERDRAREDCEHLRKTLATVASVVGAVLNPLALHGEDSLPGSAVQLPPISVSQHQYGSRGGTFAPTDHPDDARSSTNARPGTLRRWSPSLEQALPNVQLHRAEQDVRLHPPRRPHPLDPVDVQYELPEAPLSDIRPASNRPGPVRSPDHPLPVTTLPTNLPSTCILDQILNDFVRSRRQMVLSGLPMFEILGPTHPSLDHLLDLPTIPSVPDQRHPMATLLIDTISKFPDITGAPEKAATIFMMFRMLRWYICPCEPCWQLLPECMRPISAQREKPHAVWIDHIPWPNMRRVLVRVTGTTEEIALERYFIPFTKTFSINWPYPPNQIVLHSENETGPYAWKMNPVFETHICDLRNWSVGTMFKETFPILVDESVRLKEGT